MCKGFLVTFTDSQSSVTCGTPALPTGSVTEIIKHPEYGRVLTGDSNGELHIFILKNNINR